jgi:PII-like signaling protein
MNLVNRKKLDIFIEAHGLGHVQEMLGQCGFKGWSVFEGVEGSGAHGAWRQTGIGESGACLVVAIGAAEAVDKALDWLSGYFKTYPGVVAVSDVAVIRGDRF